MFFGLFWKLSQDPVLCIQGRMHLHDSYDSLAMELLIVWSSRSDWKIGKPDHNHPAFGLLPLSATEGKTHSQRQSVQRGRDSTDFNIVCSILLHVSKKTEKKIAKEEWNERITVWGKFAFFVSANEKMLSFYYMNSMDVLVSLLFCRMMHTFTWIFRHTVIKTDSCFSTKTQKTRNDNASLHKSYFGSATLQTRPVSTTPH